MWIENQSLPANRGARLFEVHAHRDENPVLELRRERGELSTVLPTGFEVVDRAGPDDYEQAAICSEQDPMNRLAAAENELGLGFRFRKRGQQFARCGERPGL